MLLEVTEVSKTFGGVRALDAVSLDLDAAEVVAVVGENGAGKSTLIKILSGIHRPDAGSVRLDGVEQRPRTPAESMASGVAVIHQELHLADNLSIAANLFLGREPLRFRAVGWIDRRRMEKRALAALGRVGLDRDPRQPVAELSPAARQLVEIARALAIEARVVVMDEPTSSLGHDDAARLLDRVEDLRRRGVGVLYVSHRLDEVVRVADRAVVLRDGRVAGELRRGGIDAARLVKLMVGRELRPRGGGAAASSGDAVAAGDLAGPGAGAVGHSDEASRPSGAAAGPGAIAAAAKRERPPAAGTAVLTARRLRVARGGPELDFELHAGEILGLFGLVGAGRTELLETLFGLRRPAGGDLDVTGSERAAAAPVSAAAAIGAGIALVPEDRKTLGLVAEMTVEENLALAHQARRPLHARRRRADERRRAVALVEALDIRPAAPGTEVRRLSGGNQQKVVLGKWLALEPRILLLDEPTRGVDVGARDEIHARLQALAASGVAIVLSSAESDEVLALADRVLVLRRGEIAGRLSGAELTEEALLRLAAGGAPAPAAPDPTAAARR
jgi:ribose transport system ATP-binding protein